MSTMLKPVYLDASRCRRVSVRDLQLLVQPSQGRPSQLPLRQISQLIVRTPGNTLLAAMTSLAQRNRPVFVVDGNHRILARLVPEQDPAHPLPWLPDLCDSLLRTSFRGYHDWLDAQKAHSCSRILRGRGQKAGDYEHCLNVLARACRKHQSKNALEHHCAMLEVQLRALIQRCVNDLRLYALEEILRERGMDLADDLAEIAWPTVLRNYHRFLSPKRDITRRRILSHWADIEGEVAKRIMTHLRALPGWVGQDKTSNRNRPRWLSLSAEALAGDDLP